MSLANQKLNKYIRENYGNIFDIIPEGIVIIDKKGFLLEVNNRIYAWLGYTKGEIIGKHLTLLPFVTKKSLMTLLRNFRKRIKGVHIPPYEIEFKTKSGKILNCVIRATPLRDDKDQVFAEMVIISNITSKKLTENALFASEQKFNALFDDAQDMIVVIDNKKRFANMNKKFQEESGFGSSLLGEKIKNCSLLTKDSCQRTENIIDALLKDKEHKNSIEVESRGKNGEGKFFECFAIPHKHKGKTVAAIIIFKDITQRKLNEAKIKENEKLFKLISENTSDFIIVVDISLNPRFQYVSNSYHTVYGYGKNELLGTLALDIVHPDDHWIIIRLLKKYIRKQMQNVFNIKSNSNEFFRFRAKSKDGKWHYVESSANIVGNQAIVITRDICDRVLSERMKKDFVSIASHQLRTPLTGISWCAELLEKEKYGPLEDKQKKLVEKISKSNNRMLRLIDDLLDVARIEETQEHKLDLKVIFLNKIIDNVVDDNFALMEKNQVDIINKIPDNFKIRADAVKLKHIFNNLINNATKYSKYGGEIIISHKEKKDEVVFGIKDQGIGIPKTQEKQVFKKLFRADNAIHAEKEGTGLGLYIAKSFVELHGGEIWFESEENQGTKFYFSIPKKIINKYGK